MKKVLLLILLPFISFAQDFKVGMNYGADANVGEEIELKFEIFPIQDQTVAANFLMFDIQYNNKLLEYVSHTFDPYNQLTGEQNNRASWSGYKFNPNFDYFTYNLYQQFLWWQGGASAASSNPYPTNTDFSVNRYTIQASEDINLNDAVLTIKFKILDRQGTDYQNYTSAFQINWANLRDDRTGDVYELTSTNHQIGLEPGGVGAGDVTLNLTVPHDNKADYGYSIYSESQLEGVDFNGDGNIDAYVPKENETPFESGNFNNEGVSSIATLTLDENYWVHTHIIQTIEEVEGQTVYGPAWLDDVVTVTDVYKIFQYSLDSDINGGGGAWEYVIQGILGEVTNDGNVDFADSYELLAHINGVSTSANVTTAENGAFNLSALMDKYGVMEGDWHTFQPTENNKSFTIGHGLRGDVDFSHSTVPTVEEAKVQTASAARSTMALMANRKVETHNLDIASQLVDGKVIVNINLDSQGLIGTQFKIKYDKSILTLEDIKYDTGNTMTNFGSVKDGVASFGSLDYQGDVSVKTGTPYQLVFIPNEAITNTAGLVSFKIVEGVKADGTKVKFQF